MPLKVRVGRIDQWVKVVTDRRLTTKARSKLVADYARDRLDQALAQNRQALGSETPYEQFVDGRKGAALESVNPDRGRIVFEFELTNDVLRWIMAELVKRSPRGPVGGAGTYRDQHILLADDIAVAIDSRVPAAAEYVFVNTTPYARKIEIGVTKSGRPFVISTETRLYDRVSQEAARRFSSLVKISYTFRALPGGYRGNRSMRYPAIIIRPR